MGKTICSPQLTARLWCHRTNLCINVCSTGIPIAHLLCSSSFLPSLLPQASSIPPPWPPTHPGFKGLEVHQAQNLSFGTSLFFFHFVPEGLPGSVMTTEAADLRDCPRRTKRTDVHRHIAENAASNSWGSDRLQSGWPPHGGDVNLKEQPFPLICSWFFFSATGKGASWFVSWLLEKFRDLLLFYPLWFSFCNRLRKG